MIVSQDAYRGEATPRRYDPWAESASAAGGASAPMDAADAMKVARRLLSEVPHDSSALPPSPKRRGSPKKLSEKDFKRKQRRKKLERQARVTVPESPYAVHPRAAGSHTVLATAKRKAHANLVLRLEAEELARYAEGRIAQAERERSQALSQVEELQHELAMAHGELAAEGRRMEAALISRQQELRAREEWLQQREEQADHMVQQAMALEKAVASKKSPPRPVVSSLTRGKIAIREALLWLLRGLEGVCVCTWRRRARASVLRHAAQERWGEGQGQ